MYTNDKHALDCLQLPLQIMFVFVTNIVHCPTTQETDSTFDSPELRANLMIVLQVARECSAQSGIVAVDCFDDISHFDPFPQTYSDATSRRFDFVLTVWHVEFPKVDAAEAGCYGHVTSSAQVMCYKTKVINDDDDYI